MTNITGYERNKLTNRREKDMMYPKIDMMNFGKYISILCQRQTSHLWAAEAKNYGDPR